MKNITRVFIWALVCTLLSSVFCFPVSALANGYYIPRNTTISFYWDLSSLRSDSITYFTNTGVYSELSYALNVWSNATDPNGNNMVTLQLTTNSSSGFKIVGTDLGADQETVGYTYITQTTGSGQIQQVAVQLNSNCFWSLSESYWFQYDLGTIVLHEVGHVLGIAHCHENGFPCSSSTCIYNNYPAAYANVMVPVSSLALTRMSLTSYDLSSLQLIYYLDYYGYFS